MTDLTDVLNAWGLDAGGYSIEKLGSGLINLTYKISGPQMYILQEVNTVIFKNPGAISSNLRLLGDWLKANHPEYLFTAPINTIAGNSTFNIGRKVYRLFSYVANSVTKNTVENAKQAFEAARQFGLFTALLADFEQSKLQYPLSEFHNLELRVKQYETACRIASAERLKHAEQQIVDIAAHEDILVSYHELINNPAMPRRVIHHDTKISNVLFDKNDNGLCVIDLDTVMPGYYISDVGDMMRTYLSPVNEEETDLDKIKINLTNFEAIFKGYMSAMGEVLSDAEKRYFIYSGKFLIYMQVLRFLTDYLNGDIYYHTTYTGQNLNRAKNQSRLLAEYVKIEREMEKIISA